MCGEYSFAQGLPIIKRVCTDGVNITISWSQNFDSCNGIKKIVLLGKPNPGSPFQRIDSFKKGVEYLHKSAYNTWKTGSYSIEYQVDCGTIKTMRSSPLGIDISPPAKIVIDSISVVGGKTILGWQKNKATDFKAYIIYYEDASGIHPFDTVKGVDSTYFYDKTLVKDPTKKAVSLTIAALDSCNNVSEISEAHTTIFLDRTFDVCKREAYLSWSTYKGWTPAFYEIFVQEPGGVFKYKNKVDGATTIAAIKMVQTGNYNFKVKAISSGGGIKSASNEVTIPLSINLGLSCNITGVSFNNHSDAHIISYYVSNPSIVKYVKIEAATDSNKLKEIAKVMLINSVNKYSYTKSGIDKSKVYYYRIVGYDDCDNPVCSSAITSIIVTKCIINKNKENEVNWNSYMGIRGGIKSYAVYRSIFPGDTNAWQRILETSPTATNYLDTDTTIDFKNDGVCYRIEATKNDNDTLSLPSVISSYSCCIGAPKLLAPNAFITNGFTSVFKPKYLYIDTTSGTLEIYSRWGERIFSTNKIYEGWDGKDNTGKRQEQGVYLYMLRYYGYDKNEYFLHGLVHLID
ncbi:MAG: gliding motility-associated C-terminal domain-containing protein [Bacteroidetes bacterium]|nr:gliding motility-associated C-terminal domain-containing protein [Bacteroidota bacterium]